MRQIRWIPIVITMVVSAVVLFGGYTLYRSQVMEKPLTAALTDIDHVQNAEVVWQPNELKLKLTLDPEGKIANVMQQVYQVAEKEAKTKKIQIDVVNTSSNAELEEWWSNALFTVAEAMSHQRYGELPVRLNELAKQDGNVQVTTAMDEYNIYISLQNKTGFKTILLPLQGSSMGVWPNEKPQSEMA